MPHRWRSKTPSQRGYDILRWLARDNAGNNGSPEAESRRGAGKQRQLPFRTALIIPVGITLTALWILLFGLPLLLHANAVGSFATPRENIFAKPINDIYLNVFIFL